MPSEPRGTPGVGPGDDGVIALPLTDAAATVAFYRALGAEVTETPLLVQVQLGSRLLNFHRPELMLVGFKLRPPAAPPCIQVVWDGPAGAMRALVDQAGAASVDGPVGREGGGRTPETSVYLRDPDGNLLEILTPPTTVPHDLP